MCVCVCVCVCVCLCFIVFMVHKSQSYHVQLCDNLSMIICTTVSSTRSAHSFSNYKQYVNVRQSAEHALTINNVSQYSSPKHTLYNTNYKQCVTEEIVTNTADLCRDHLLSNTGFY